MLEVRNLSVTYGSGDEAVTAVKDISFTVRKGEFVCVVGPSGCGKTTLLKCFSGLLQPTSGSVVLEGRVITSPPKEIALVFQEYGRSLLPWMTVQRNVVLPLKNRGVAKTARDAAAAEALAAVGLEGFATRYPWQLSGGMQQRVAIARALAYQPDVLLLDEPFASVDAQTRADLEDLMLRVRRSYGMTVVFVTHDIDESVYLGDRVVVLSSPPSTVREELDVDLPAERDQVTTKELPEFAHLRAHVFRMIKRAETTDEAPTEQQPDLTALSGG